MRPSCLSGSQCSIVLINVDFHYSHRGSDQNKRTSNTNSLRLFLCYHLVKKKTFFKPFQSPFEVVSRADLSSSYPLNWHFGTETLCGKNVESCTRKLHRMSQDPALCRHISFLVYIWHVMLVHVMLVHECSQNVFHLEPELRYP